MMYLHAQSGSQHAVNAGTIRLYSSIEKVGARIIDDFIELLARRPKQSYSLDSFIIDGRSFRVYRVEADTGKAVSKYMGKRLLEELKKCEELKPLFTKALLRG